MATQRRLTTAILLASCSLGALATSAGHAEEADYILHSFGSGTDGNFIVSTLIKVGGLFYGTTTNGGTYGTGTIYSMTPQGAEKVLYNFGSTAADGVAPYGALIYIDGVFYGTTNMGGTEEQGTVFSFIPPSTEKVLYSFTGGSLGTDPNDGASPRTGLFYFDGALYGTTYIGGDGRDGVVFKVTPDGTETIVHAFTGGPGDGAYPSGGLIKAGDVLYGVTSAGGSSGNGTIYSLTSTGSYNVIYSFQGGKADGSYPSGELLDIGGTLYGTTQQGGYYGGGTVFSVTPAGAEHIINSFGALKGGKYPGGGKIPRAGLIEVGGLLFGTTYTGGRLNGGVVFSMTLQGAETVVHSSLGGLDGSFYYARMTNGGDALYSVAFSGGSFGAGVAFRLKIPAQPQ